MTENLDAMRAVEHVPLEDRDAFKAALGATLVKHHGHRQGVRHGVRGLLLDVQPGRRTPTASPELDAEGSQADFEQLRAAMDSGGAMGQVSNEELAQMLLDALMHMDREQLRLLAAAAVARFAGMEPGRPVGGAYYLYRTLRQLDADGLVAKMMEQAQQDDGRSATARSTSGSRAKTSRAG